MFSLLMLIAGVFLFMNSYHLLGFAIALVAMTLGMIHR